MDNGTLPERPLAFTTVVTTPLTWEVAASYGVEVVSVLTGFHGKRHCRESLSGHRVR